MLPPPARYFNPRSPCGERLNSDSTPASTAVISIHALLAESDWRRYSRRGQWGYFNPRSPCGERHGACIKTGTIDAISIHALLAESDNLDRGIRAGPGEISIHALLAESDSGARAPSRAYRNFNPRSPCGERQEHTRQCVTKPCISIHALLAESDSTSAVISPSR